ncbi:WD40 repeat domain-containing protein [Aquabacter cavernae]|uniref:WD40 repeat domain-containing protein n=1 Tax=Aquabacter cavernae TaxID=2496029 RepID=UPI000F8C528D|nr:WD40 repeat domain-containing protein [Aquabacter cavernae]
MSSAPASLTDKVRPFTFDSAIAATAFLGPRAVFVEDQGTALLTGGEETRVKLHDGVVLETVGDGRRLLTAGDDGTVRALGADGTVSTLAEHKNRWIDHVALGADGSFAYSVGKTAYFVPAKGEERRALDVASTVGGLAFAPKGTRLGIAHYGGVTLWFPNAAGVKPEGLGWKGSHLGVAFSPDGRFLVTTMQEPALHGWRLSDGGHMRMSGYPARVKSYAFTADGKWLASSGSGEAILWPFQSKEGPMGKQPAMLAPAPDTRVAQVACHPKDPVVAVGYENGMVLMARITDGAEILLRAPDASRITGLAWRADGGAVAFGTEGGAGGLLEF